MKEDVGPSVSEREGAGAGQPRSLQRGAGSSASNSSRNSQLVDLVVEDREAEERDRVQAQREFGSAWTGTDQRHFQ